MLNNKHEQNNVYVILMYVNLEKFIKNDIILQFN